MFAAGIALPLQQRQPMAGAQGYLLSGCRSPAPAFLVQRLLCPQALGADGELRGPHIKEITLFLEALQNIRPHMELLAPPQESSHSLSLAELRVRPYCLCLLIRAHRSGQSSRNRSLLSLSSSWNSHTPFAPEEARETQVAAESQQKGALSEDVGLRRRAVDKAVSSHAAQPPPAPGTSSMIRSMWLLEQAPFWSQAAMDPAPGLFRLASSLNLSGLVPLGTPLAVSLWPKP